MLLISLALRKSNEMLGTVIIISAITVELRMTFVITTSTQPIEHLLGLDQKVFDWSKV